MAAVAAVSGLALSVMRRRPAGQQRGHGRHPGGRADAASDDGGTARAGPALNVTRAAPGLVDFSQSSLRTAADLAPIGYGRLGDRCFGMVRRALGKNSLDGVWVGAI